MQIGDPPSREHAKHVTFGSVKVKYVPRYRSISSSSSSSFSFFPHFSADSQTTAELTLLEPPTKSAGELEDVATVTSDSESSLLLTQTALSSTLPLHERKDVLSTFFENDDDEQATCTRSGTDVMQELLLSSDDSAHGVDPQHHGSKAAFYEDIAKEPEIIEDTQMLSSFGLKSGFLLEKRSEEENNLTVAAAARSTFCCAEEVLGAASPATCIFCHENSGVIHCYNGQYLHLACALWCPEVYYDREEGTLKNVDVALQRSCLIKCAYCRQPGAPIGCVNERCQRSYHLQCALQAGSFLNEKTFELFCPKHSKEGVGVVK